MFAGWVSRSSSASASTIYPLDRSRLGTMIAECEFLRQSKYRPENRFRGAVHSLLDELDSINGEQG